MLTATYLEANPVDGHSVAIFDNEIINLDVAGARFVVAHDLPSYAQRHRVASGAPSCQIVDTNRAVRAGAMRGEAPPTRLCPKSALRRRLFVQASERSCDQRI